MMKHTIKRTLPALCTAVLCLLGGHTLSASAYTAEDVASRARAAGWPEYLIQAGYNEWSSGSYTQEQLDKAYASVSQYNDQTGQLIANSLGVEYSPSSPSSPAADPPTEAPSSDPGTPDSPASSPSQNGNAAAPDAPAQKPTPAPAAPSTVTKKDGTTEERISKSDFTRMTLEEKKEYVNSLSEESKKEFMNTLSTEERNSILKQLPAEEKAALIQNYVDAAKDMGMNVSVDNIADNNISMTIRNEEGQVIGKTAVGTIIDETGISHTGQLVTAFLAALVSVFGFAMLYRWLSREDQ